MTADGVNYPHTAITTWSGFVYQGKVAIYHVLKLLMNQGVASKFSLQLDSLEDFTILDEGASIISLHQVKALKSNYYSAYQTAFEKLKDNSDTQKCSSAYFHVAKEITDQTCEEIEKKHAPVKLYDYGLHHCCALCDLDKKIEDSIQKIYLKYFPCDTPRQSPDYLRKARGYLDQIVLKKVLNIHSMIHDDIMSDRKAAYKEIIPCSEFWDILARDLNQEDLGNDYYFWVLLNDLCRYYQEFCIENEIIDKFDCLKLSDCMRKITGLEKDPMMRFLRYITPHREFIIGSLSDYKDNTFHQDEIQDAFLRMLYELRAPEFDINKFFRWTCSDNTFTPTTIDKGSDQTSKMKLCKRIIDNALKTDLDVLYESGSLITTEIDVPSIVDCVPNVIDTLRYDDKRSNLITRWKRVSLVSLKSAKEKINA